MYIGAVALANVSVAILGPVAMPVNAFLLIGPDLTCRDALHEAWHGRGLVWRMGAVVLAGGIISALVLPASQRIALASAIAFVVSGAVDALIYHWLLARSIATRVNVSNSVSAAVDSVVFPTLAFGAWMPVVCGAQWIAKVCGGYLWSCVLLKKRRR